MVLFITCFDVIQISLSSTENNSTGCTDHSIALILIIIVAVIFTRTITGKIQQFQTVSQQRNRIQSGHIILRSYFRISRITCSNIIFTHHEELQALVTSLFFQRYGCISLITGIISIPRQTILHQERRDIAA